MSDRPSVMFVCVHNAGRSQMAAGFMTALSDGQVEVRSAGSAPPRVRENWASPCATSRVREPRRAWSKSHTATGSSPRNTPSGRSRPWSAP